VLVAGQPAEVVKEVEDSVWQYAGDQYVEIAREHAETDEPIAEAHVPDED
jgi:hypothetical protein